MKRLIVAILVLAICGVLFAQASPFSFYGSARGGIDIFKMDSFPKQASQAYTTGAPDSVDSRMHLLQGPYLQKNSRIGLNYEKDNLTGKVEFGFNDGDAEFRLLYGKYDFDGWSILAGKDYDGTNMLSNQVYDNDRGLKGYGAIDGGRNLQIKFGFMEDALYLALIAPNTSNDPAVAYVEELIEVAKENGAPQADIDDLEKSKKAVLNGIETMFPKINLGYKLDINDDITVHPTVMLQMYNYNKDFAGIEGSVMSWLFGVTYDHKLTDEMKLRVGGYVGSNIYQMGYTEKETPANIVESRDPATAPYDGKYETEDVMSMGGYLTFGYALSEQFALNVGAGYAMSTLDSKYPDNSPGAALGAEKSYDPDNRMAFYLQAPYKCLGALTITPEFGMFMEMNDKKGEDEKTSSMYLGTQLRYDF